MNIFKNKLQLSFFMCFSFIGSLIQVSFALVLNALINVAVEKDMNQFLKIFIFAILYVIVNIFIDFFYNIYKKKINKNHICNFKKNLYNKAISLSLKDFNNISSGTIINDLTNTISQYEKMYVLPILSLPNLLCGFIIASTMTAYMNKWLLILIVLIGFVTLKVSQIASNNIQKSTAELIKSNENYIKKIKDQFEGFLIIKAFNLKNESIKQTSGVIEKVQQSNYANEKNIIATSYISMFLGLLSTVITMGIACLLVIRGNIEVGAVMAIAQLTGRIISPISSLGSTYATIKAGHKVKEKLNKLLTLEDEVIDSIEFDSLNSIELKDVTFSCNNKDIIKNLSFNFEKGKKYAIMGSVGSGKSSLVKVIAGLYKHNTGNIIYTKDNTYKYNNMSSNIAYVPQETYIFEDTLINNLTLYSNYTQQQINYVIDACKINEIIEKLPKGIDTMLSCDETNLSGGEKQRIGVARALLRNSNVLLLDEYTSSMDSVSSKYLENIIMNIKDKIIIFITHKIDSEILSACDEILILEDGELKKHDNYNTLVTNNYF